MGQTILVLAAVVIAIVQAFPPDLQMKFMTDIMPKCSKENGLKQSAVLSFASGDIPPTKANKCFTKCAFIKFGLMDSKGAVSTNNDFIKKVRKANAKEADVYVKCAGDKANAKGEACETAYAVMQCVNKKI